MLPFGKYQKEISKIEFEGTLTFKMFYCVSSNKHPKGKMLKIIYNKSIIGLPIIWGIGFHSHYIWVSNTFLGFFTFHRWSSTFQIQSSELQH